MHNQYYPPGLLPVPRVEAVGLTVTAPPTPPGQRDAGPRASAKLVRRLAEEPAAGVGDADPDLLVALQALSVQDAEVLRLWASEQLWASQIVTVLGITTNAASIRLHRAANTLRNELLTRKQPRAAGHLVEHRERRTVTPDDDALRARLARLDPVPPSRAVYPPTSPRAHELLERAMTLTTEQRPPPTRPPVRWRKPSVLAAATAAVLALAVGGRLAIGGSVNPPAVAKTSIALKSAGGGPSSAWCTRFSVDILEDMPVVFFGPPQPSPAIPRP